MQMLDADQATATLRAAGMRVTPQRRAVIETLSGDRSHPTAEQVAERVTAALPGISLSTIYNILHELAQAGLVLEVTTPGALRFDPETTAHAHFACVRCGEVTDVALTTKAMDDLARAAGTSSVSVTLSGECSACSQRESELS